MPAWAIPEAEVIFPRSRPTSPAICRAILDRRLGARTLRLNDRVCCDVVATQGPTEGYPGWPFGAFSRHHPISGIEAVDPGALPGLPRRGRGAAGARGW